MLESCRHGMRMQVRNLLALSMSIDQNMRAFKFI